MMDLDEMKQQWVEHDRKLDQTIRLNRQLLSATHLNGARTALHGMTAFLTVEAVVWLGIMMALGSFVYEHSALPRFAGPAVLLELFVAGMLAATIRQVVAAREIDYFGPIASIQKQIETLRVLRVRTTQWAILAGAVVWAPFVIVAGRFFFGLRVYSAAWLWANVLFGLALIPLALWVSERFGDRVRRSPLVQQVMNDMSGHSLNTARAFLAGVSEFEHEAN
jgi:hypothetical protein